MLFLAPLPLVPLLVAAGFTLGRIRDSGSAAKRGHALSDLAGHLVHDRPGLGARDARSERAARRSTSIDIYLLAFVAQIAHRHTGMAVVQDWLADDRQHVWPMLWSYRVDAGSLRSASCSRFRPRASPSASSPIVPLLWLLHVFSQERKERYNASLELHNAYRGTVMLLSDVVEAEDDYTAFHCRSVVELVAEVAEEMNIPKADRQELEFAALLHDVGKIAIPKEILNKPSKLTDEEFELIKTHTIEGQHLLDRVGGLMGRVGKIVRSCHERWDGKGYPDGLAGEDIPLAARIVFCCDAYNAMTTDRPYRKAMRTRGRARRDPRQRGLAVRPDHRRGPRARRHERRALPAPRRGSRRVARDRGHAERAAPVAAAPSRATAPPPRPRASSARRPERLFDAVEPLDELGQRLDPPASGAGVTQASRSAKADAGRDGARPGAGDRRARHACRASRAEGRPTTNAIVHAHASSVSRSPNTRPSSSSGTVTCTSSRSCTSTSPLPNPAMAKPSTPRHDARRDAAASRKPTPVTPARAGSGASARRLRAARARQRAGHARRGRRRRRAARSRHRPRRAPRREQQLADVEETGKQHDRGGAGDHGAHAGHSRDGRTPARASRSERPRVARGARRRRGERGRARPPRPRSSGR